MRCTLDGGNARIIAKAIQSLAKFGTDLFIEADKDGLQLRSINSTRSAVGTFRFNRTFFESYQVKTGDENYCKISMKACLQVFRNMKQVEHCEFRILMEQLKFQVQLRCRLETIKTALLSIVDEENIAAAVSPDNTSNIIVGSYKIFGEISANFNATEEEITLETVKQGLTAKNYMEGSRVGEKFMRSQLKLTPGEFDKYEIETETNVTFCLKEFRAFLMFAENVNENLVLQFEEAGSPIFLRIKRYDQVEGLLIMSTLSPDDVSFHEDCRESEITDIADKSINRATQKRKHRANATASSSKKRIADATTLDNESGLFQFHGDNVSSANATCQQSVDVPRHQADKDDADVEMIDEHNDILLAAMSSIENQQEVSVLHRATEEPRSTSEFSITFYDTEERNQAAVANNHKEAIPQSPTHQDGVRKIFSRCFLSTYVPREPSPSSQVYVPNSDAED